MRIIQRAGRLESLVMSLDAVGRSRSMSFVASDWLRCRQA